MKNKAALYWVMAVGILFAGFSLLSNILMKVSLVTMLVISFSVFISAVLLTWTRASPQQRYDVVRRALIGAIAGLIAAAIYDVAKHTFSVWDSERYFPFVANRMFGQLLLGPSFSESQWMTAGMGFHFLVGACFGVSFCLLFARFGIVGGILWGIFLELFQVILYPDWLGIKFMKEFFQFSFIAHIIFGVSLALLCRFGLSLKAFQVRLQTPND